MPRRDVVESVFELRTCLQEYLQERQDFVVVTPLLPIADLLIETTEQAADCPENYADKCFVTETLYPGQLALAFFVLPKKLAGEVAHRFHAHDLIRASNLEEQLVGCKVHVMDTDSDRAYGIGTWIDGLLL